MPLALQSAFFGALLSAIMSTASATSAGPSTAFVGQNVLRNIKPGLSDAQTLKAMRLSVLVFTICVLIYAITMQDSSIYRNGLGRVPGAAGWGLTPLVFRSDWKRATTQGAVAAVVLGIGVWMAVHRRGGLGGGLPAAIGRIVGGGQWHAGRFLAAPIAAQPPQMPWCITKPIRRLAPKNVFKVS